MNFKPVLSIFLLSSLIIFSCKNKTAEKKLESIEGITRVYPKTGSVERLSPMLDNIVEPGVLPEIIADSFAWSEGPLWIPELEMLLFSDIPENSVFQWTEKDGLKLYLKPSGYTDTLPRGRQTGSNGLLLDPLGRLVLCQHGDRRMARMDAPLDNPEPKYITLADNWEGKRLNSPNDAVYNSHGELFFTDPLYGLEFRGKDPKRELDFLGVYKLSTKGELSLLTSEMTAPNGIGLSPDETILYVANSGGKDPIWMKYEFAKDGSLFNPLIFYDASEAREAGRKGSPDGMAVRSDGVIFATGPGGVWIFTPEAEHLGTILTGQATSNCTLNQDETMLYITADMYLMRIALK